MNAPERSLATFHVGDLWLGVDIERIREINRIQDVTPVPNTAKEVLGLINLRGHLVTILDLSRILFGISGSHERGAVNVIIQDSGGEEIGLRADRLADVEDYVESDLEPIPRHMDDSHGQFMRGVLQRHGSVLAVVDVHSVIESKTTREGVVA